MDFFQSSAIFTIILQIALFLGARIKEWNQLKPKDWLLLLFLTNLVLHFSNIYAFQFNPDHFPIRFHGVFCAAYGPLLWLNLKVRYEGSIIWRPKALWHFAPSFIILFFSLAACINSDFSGLPFLQEFIFLQTFAYLFFIFYKILVVRDSASVKLEWLVWILPVFTLLILIAFIDLLRWKFSLSIDASLIFTAISGVALILTSGIIYKGLIKNDSIQKKVDSIETSTKIYAKNLSSNQKKQHIAHQIKIYFEEQQPYLDSSLSIHHISEKLNIPSYLISRVINEILGCTFPEFVNSYRVEAAKNLLKKTDLKILSIAFDSGFANKTTFNRVFKDFTKKSPSEFKNLNPLIET